MTELVYTSDPDNPCIVRDNHGGVYNYCGGIDQQSSPVSVPPVVSPSVYTAVTDTIGKLKACGSKWSVVYNATNVPPNVGTVVAAANARRVLLVIMPLANSEKAMPVGTDDTNGGLPLDATAQAQVIGYDIWGIVVQESWKVYSAIGGFCNTIEIVANT